MDLNTQSSAQRNLELPPASAEPVPPAAEPSAPLKQQIADALTAHRTRRPAPDSPAKSSPRRSRSKSSRVADAVASRYAEAQSYREYLTAEATEALRRATAAAEVATRNAEAIAAEHQSLLSELAREEQIHTVESDHFLLAAAAEPVIAAPPPPAYESATPYTPTPLPANLIQFPRILVAPQKARPRLAEGPLRDSADIRIFEDAAPAPADPPTLPIWSNLRLDDAIAAAQFAPPAASQPALYPAQLAPRLRAAVADSALVAVATAAFVAVFTKLAHHFSVMPEKKSAAIALLAVFALLQIVYQLLFFSFNESTPGMRLSRIGLCTFTDENPSRTAMRWRIAASVLAAVPMGLGLLWAWFDDDRLGWHDRITHTYQRSY